MKNVVVVLAVPYLFLLSCDRDSIRSIPDRAGSDIEKAKSKDVAFSEKEEGDTSTLSDTLGACADDCIADANLVRDKCPNGLRRVEQTQCDGKKWTVPPPGMKFESGPWRVDGRGRATFERESLTELDEEYGDRGAYLVWGFTPAEDLKPAASRPFDLYATDGQSFRLHLLLWLPPQADPAGKSLFVSAFKGYQATETIFRRRNTENTKVVRKLKSTGEKIPLNDRAVFIDIEIPAEEFTEKRAYEIALGIALVSEEGKRTGIIDATQRRYWFYNGGVKHAEPPRCASASLDEEFEGFEREAFLELFDARYSGLIAYPADKKSVEDLREFPEGYEVEESCSTLRILASFVDMDPRVRDVGGMNTVRSVVIPIVDWKPLDKPLYYDRSLDFTRIDARMNMDVHVPEGGETTVFFMSWPFAFVPVKQPGRERARYVPDDGRTISNVVKLRRPAEE